MKGYDDEENALDEYDRTALVSGVCFFAALIAVLLAIIFNTLI